jgi:hypothetical protein
MSDQKESSNLPFRVIKRDEMTILTLPSNFENLIEFDEWKFIFAILTFRGNVGFEVTEHIFDQKKSDKEMSNFFRGLLSRFRSLDREDENAKINLTGTNAITRGRAYVDLLTLRCFSRGIFGLEDYLPSTVFVETAAKRTYLSYYLGLA